ncbi:MAG: hypothetical protein COB02_16465 [Candidatus Cloacimonadota bacterium]|nr:MAG: hypothetical protein COB02_16465 [Candidatus Cloacimonadota bacterium]
MATIVKAYHGFSAIGDNTQESYKQLLLKKPLLSKLDNDKKNQIKTILKNVNHFRIKVSLNNLETTNRLICEGPLKIRYAQLILLKMKEFIDYKDSHFYASNMNDFSPVGMRNTFRILSNQNFDYDEETYLKGAIKAIKHLNPITPLLNIPNNLLSIIALEHKLKNSNVNFMGENSSSQAIDTAINRVSNFRFKEVFVLSSMFLHFNFVKYLLYFEHYSCMDILLHSPISEYAGGIIFQKVKSIENGQIEILFNKSFPPITTNKIFNLKGQKVKNQIQKYQNILIDNLSQINLKLNNIDLILFQGFHQGSLSILENDSKRFLDISPYSGYNLCSSAMALCHYACEFLNDNNNNIKSVLVIEQGIQGSLWATIFQKNQGL